MHACKCVCARGRTHVDEEKYEGSIAPHTDTHTHTHTEAASFYISHSLLHSALCLCVCRAHTSRSSFHSGALVLLLTLVFARMTPSTFTTRRRSSRRCGEVRLRALCTRSCESERERERCNHTSKKSVSPFVLRITKTRVSGICVCARVCLLVRVYVCIRRTLSFPVTATLRARYRDSSSPLACSDALPTERSQGEPHPTTDPVSPCACRCRSVYPLLTHAHTRYMEQRTGCTLCPPLSNYTHPHPPTHRQTHRERHTHVRFSDEASLEGRGDAAAPSISCRAKYLSNAT
jgi:hypothetical protein